MTLPSWYKCRDIVPLDRTPLEQFIFEHEPLHQFDARQWRKELLELLNYKIKFCLDDTFIETVDDQEARCDLENSNPSIGRLDRFEATSQDISQLELMGFYSTEPNREVHSATHEWESEFTD